MSIQIQNLTKKYFLKSETITILDQLSADIKKGEIVAILGKSGSGKSTLLSLLAGLDRIDAGEIIIDGQHLEKLDSSELISFRAEKIGIVFQQFYLVSHLSAIENLKLPLDILKKKYTREDLLKSLESVGLSHRATHKPSELSGGESQRLAIARALITEPQLLLADEPSGSLDEETGQKVMDMFFSQVKKNNTTTLLVTHDQALASRCDRVLELHMGRFTN